MSVSGRDSGANRGVHGGHDKRAVDAGVTRPVLGLVATRPGARSSCRARMPQRQSHQLLDRCVRVELGRGAGHRAASDRAAEAGVCNSEELIQFSGEELSHSGRGYDGRRHHAERSSFGCVQSLFFPLLLRYDFPLVVRMWA